MNEDQKLDRISQLLSSAYRISEKCDQNMRSLNTMMLELKGVIASVRASARKNDWYGTEINADPINKSGMKYLEEKHAVKESVISVEYESDK